MHEPAPRPPSSAATWPAHEGQEDVRGDDVTPVRRPRRVAGTAQQHETWRPGPFEWAVVAIGIALRLLWATVGARSPRILADPALYQQAALRIAAGEGYVGFNGFPTSYYPPGYPWFLGSFQWLLERVGLGEHTIGAVALLQALLSGIAILAVMVVGHTLAGRRAALAAGLALALWPNLIAHSSLMLSETLFVTLLSIALAATVTMVQADRLVPWRAAVAGLAMGAATLVRPQVLVVVVAAVVAWSLSRLGWRDVVRRTAVLAVGVVVVVAPWTIRNAIVFDAFVPVSTNDGDNLCVGFNPDATGHFGIPDACDTGEFYIDGPDAELRRQAETRSRAIEWILEHPGEQPELAWKKLWWTYSNDTDAVWASLSFGRDPWLQDGGLRAVRIVSSVYYAAVMLAAIVGAVLTARRGWRTRRVDPTGLLVVLGALASSLVPVMFFGDPRFKVASTPFYVVLAGAAIAAAIELRRDRPTQTPAPQEARE